MFRNRKHAGAILGERMVKYASREDTVVLGLPRGGVPVAAEVAKRIRAPMDVFVVRKLGAPGHEELAIGAIASGGVEYLNQDLIDQLHISDDEIRDAVGKETTELHRRESRFREGRTHPDIAGKIVIIVDDGLATGATMKAAISAIRTMNPQKIVVAVPVAPEATAVEISELADELVCLENPPTFYGVGGSYENFDQTTDAEVIESLNGRGSISRLRRKDADPISDT
jgi:putative phosphoribosyl transferase